MRPKTFFLLIFLAAVISSVFSCKDEWSSSDVADKSVSRSGESESLNLLLSEAGWFPDGSTVEKLDNGAARITAPDGWLYLGKDSGGTIHAISGGGIDVSCDCTQGSGCDPYIRGFDHCCNMKTNCTKCDKTVKSKDIQNGKIVEFTVQKGGYINLSLGVSFETENRKLPSVFDEMFEFQPVIDGVQSFISENGLTEFVNHSLQGEETYNFVLNVYGRRGIISIPKAFIDNLGTTAILALEKLIVDDKGYSCSCTSGSCVLKTFMGVKYCESDNCSGTCTLSSSGLVNPDYQEAKQAKVYKY